MLIAFPFVLLPLWIAVRRGLAPLRNLAERVALRSPTDFSPLGVELQHAQLKPVVAAIEALLARSREGIARERAFVQDAAHELQTPLAVIAGQAHALNAAEAQEDRARAKAALEQAIARASHLTHQLLTLARLEGDTDAGMAAVNLVELAQRVLVDAEPAAAARGIELALDSPDRLDATLDENALHSILENLVGNAIKYGRDGGRVVVGIVAAGDALTLSVADDGPGIAAAQRAQLFERFRRGNHDGIGGAGLGLAIVRQATGRLGGRIECGKGLDGRGIGFAITLPAPAARSHRPAA